ncbi:MAG: histidine--tRNA ligase [Tenericutes bacterium HGW-Tenericutes-4]|nr:MAG: histidine--tRNA ligase [Tenericutes bacterium HGW-Tenericutes-4]
MSDTKIMPKTLPGFMELLPKEQILFNEFLKVIKETYERYGFLPLDTPVIENAEVLLAKAGGETEKQIYRFNKGENDLVLRFDHTVPLAKFVAANVNELNFPFRAYQIGKVYRGEKPQKGRFREFYQCDIDIVGKDTLSVINDAEIPSVIYDVFSKLNIGEFVIELSNRKLLKGLMEHLNLENLTTEVLRIVDKYEKIGRANVNTILVEMLKENTNSTDKYLKYSVNTILDFITISGSYEEKIKALNYLNVEIVNETFTKGVNELTEVVNYIKVLGVPDNYFDINLIIARGLDYYTGTVYETFLTNYKSLGSICSGGRYDNLAEFYTNQKLPGVGISIGLTRLFDQLKDKELLATNKKSITDVLIVPMIGDYTYALLVATYLRNQGINVEVYLEEVKFKNKLSYANKQEVPFVIIIGEDEVNNNVVALKNMKTGEQSIISLEEVLTYIKKQ